jgi:hypothetical protein
MLGKEKNRTTFEGAIRFLRKALTLDQNYSQAYACLAFAHIFEYQNRWSDDPDNSLKLAKQYAQQAVENDANEPLGHCVAGLATLFERDVDHAKSEADLALRLNPNSAIAIVLEVTVALSLGGWGEVRARRRFALLSRIFAAWMSRLRATVRALVAVFTPDPEQLRSWKGLCRRRPGLSQRKDLISWPCVQRLLRLSAWGQVLLSIGKALEFWYCGRRWYDRGQQL